MLAGEATEVKMRQSESRYRLETDSHSMVEELTSKPRKPLQSRSREEHWQPQLVSGEAAFQKDFDIITRIGGDFLSTYRPNLASHKEAIEAFFLLSYKGFMID